MQQQFKNYLTRINVSLSFKESERARKSILKSKVTIIAITKETLHFFMIGIIIFVTNTKLNDLLSFDD